MMKQTIHYNKLKTAINSGDAVIFVGSGLSTPIYGTWFEVIKKLCLHCNVSQPSKDEPKHLMSKADTCRLRDLSKYRECLLRHFQHQQIIQRQAYNLLAEINAMIYITTNFDPLLENALKEKSQILGVQIYDDLNVLDLRDDHRNLIYLHGKIIDDDVSSVDRIVLGKEKFNEAYGLGGSAGAFLQQLSARKQLVFIGFGLKDPFTLEILKKTKHMNSNGFSEPHYALLQESNKVIAQEISPIPQDTSESEDERFDNSLKNNSGINVIRYPYSDRFHSVIEDILKELKPVPPLDDLNEVKI